jgi:hypothetical protein
MFDIGFAKRAKTQTRRIELENLPIGLVVRHTTNSRLQSGIGAYLHG